MANIYGHKKIKIDESGGYYTSLPCHTCKKQVALSAHSCPHCGETDPFYFQEYKRLINKRSWYLRILGLIAIFLCIGQFNNGWVSGVISIAVASIILWAIYLYFDNKLFHFTESVKGNFSANSTDTSTWIHYLAKINENE
ncbi:MAG: hypothetical protein LBC68_09720 [Prevotellaceae bacterium]|jgi:hypothetical protein|nr:hypothetical protein [Prevotellaceae bacterium]